PYTTLFRSHAGTPLPEAPEESGPIGREQQRGKDSGHEEDERVQQGQDAEASGRLAEQIDRESRRDRASGGITRVRVHEGDVLVHVEAPTLVLQASVALPAPC